MENNAINVIYVRAKLPSGRVNMITITMVGPPNGSDWMINEK
jgi:hypothetical protein